MSIAVHLNFSRRGRPVITTTPAQRLEAITRIQRIGVRFGLVLCAVLADHIHVVALCDSTRAGALAQAIESSLTQVWGFKPGFSRYFVTPVSNQLHLEKLVDYVLRQAEKHNDPSDPDHLGTNGPELVGGRLLRLKRGGLVIPSTRVLFRDAIPRIKDDAVERILLGGRRRSPVASFSAAPAGLAGSDLEEVLCAAAAGAIGLPSMPRRGAGVSAARAALLRLVSESPFAGSVEPRRMVGVGRSAFQELRRCEPAAAIANAVRWQVEFRLTRRETELRG